MSIRFIKTFLVLAVVFLQGCGTVKGWFSDDEKDPRQPAELERVSSSLKIKKLWSVGVGNGQGEGFYKINPIIGDKTIFAAANDGQVKSIERFTGKVNWKIDLATQLSGGVGLYKKNLFIGTADGSVIKLNATDGSIVWSSVLTGEVLSAPESNGRVVAVQTYDGKLFGLDFDTGQTLWTYKSSLPVLTIRGTGTPIVKNSRVYAGFANGRVMAFDISTGSILWETRVAIAQGRSDIERIVDIDGKMSVQGDQLFAAAYQGRVVAIDMSDGNRIWQREVSSVSGTSVGFGNVYVIDDDGTVFAYLVSGQGIRWDQDSLLYRDLSRPTPILGYVAVVDFEGYLHFMSQLNGEFVGRIRLDKTGARADMVSVGNTLYVYGNSGKLFAYEINSKNI